MSLKAVRRSLGLPELSGAQSTKALEVEQFQKGGPPAPTEPWHTLPSVASHLRFIACTLVHALWAQWVWVPAGRQLPLQRQQALATSVQHFLHQQSARTQGHGCLHLDFKGQGHRREPALGSSGVRVGLSTDSSAAESPALDLKPGKDAELGLQPQWAWKTERTAEEDYSLVSKAWFCLIHQVLDLPGICSFFVPVFPFWNGMSIPCMYPLYFGNTQRIGFTGSQLESNLPEEESYSSLTILFQ